MDVATLGGGCFWCVEAVLSRLDGVECAVPGYCGGAFKHPTYEQVCRGITGHAEVVRVQFHPNILSYQDLLDVFFATHDPTTPNRQGHDVGSQYRSVIFVHSAQQRAIAQEVIARLDASRTYPNPVVTELFEVGEFYPAEEFHRSYFSRNPKNKYCQVVVREKLDELERLFLEKLKPL